MKSFKISQMIALATLAITSMSSFSTNARADEVDCVFGFQNCESAAEWAQAISLSSIILPLLSSGAATAAHDRKEILAHSALEDAAVYFESGRLTGILPAAIQDIKRIIARRDGVVPESVSDAEAVDALAAVAEAALR